MPGGDRTGPTGAGPMTGRGVGICAGYGVPGYMNPGFGRAYGAGRGRGFGRGMGMGGGRGWRHQYYRTGLPGWARGGWAFGRSHPAFDPMMTGPAATPEMVREEELNYLIQEAKNLKMALKDIEARIQQLQREADVDAQEPSEESI